jgi:hypothetical protein
VEMRRGARDRRGRTAGWTWETCVIRQEDEIASRIK